MRYVVLDTETTGLEPHVTGDMEEDPKKKEKNHRLIEIGCVEIIDGKVTDRTYHQYFNPKRDIDPGAERVHGISIGMLQDKPEFKKKAQDFLAYIQGATLIIHNAPFDLKFLNAELAWADKEDIKYHVAGVIDTLKWARDLYPGHKNTLDALCDRMQIDRSKRDVHGAMIDVLLLADVYEMLNRVRMQRNKKWNCPIEIEDFRPLEIQSSRKPRVLIATPEEMQKHEQHLQSLDKVCKGKTIWMKTEIPPSNTMSM